uniref:Aminotransferase class I/classII domain-containing protein n=1 Tax=Ditylenchus dipsaci TaxID=166011 RepID=A0A915DCA1_9BILA
MLDVSGAGNGCIGRLLEEGCSNPTKTTKEISPLITKINNTIEVVGQLYCKEEQYLNQHLKYIQAANPASNQFFPAPTSNNLIGINKKMQKIMEMGELDQDISSDPTSNLPSAREVCKDRWHSNHNPEGKIDLCNDHNNLCEELFRHKINKTWPSGVDLAALLRQSPTPGGRKSTKKAVMSCIRHFFCANEQNQRSAKDLILTPGSDAAHDMLSLCCFPRRCDSERAQVELRAVSSQNMLDIHLDTAIFQQALVEAVTQGQNVRAILLTQPHNPLGLAFDWDQISKLCQWAVKNNLWILIDETFVSHIAKPNKNESAIKSFVSLADQSDLRQKLIWIWSVDKDMCLPGLRFAVIHTQNDEVHKALSRLENHPTIDLEFINAATAIYGCAFCETCCWLFYFFVFTKIHQENTFEEEEILWKRFMSEASIYLNPGMFMGTSDAGWFQLIISMDKTELQEALNRLAAVLNSIGGKDNSAEHGDSLSLSMLPAETSRVPTVQASLPLLVALASEDGASASDPSPTELPSGADNAVGRNSDVDQSELHLASNTPPFPASQMTSPDAASSVLHSKPSIDSIDDTQVKKASVSSATDYTIYGHQPAQDSLEEANHQKEVSKAPIPEKKHKSPSISPRETDKSWDDEKYPYSYTHVSNPADDAALLNRVFVFPASHLEWKEEITLSPDAKSRELLYQRIHYASEQRALQRQASVAKKKLSAIDEGEDHLQEDSHTPPTVPSHITDFSFIEQLVSGGAQSNISILPENYLAEQQANHPSESQFKYQVDEMVDHPVYLPADHLDSHLAIDHQTEKRLTT